MFSIRALIAPTILDPRERRNRRAPFPGRP
jgi:hypothetical protein